MSSRQISTLASKSLKGHLRLATSGEKIQKAIKKTWMAQAFSRNSITCLGFQYPARYKPENASSAQERT